MAKTILKSGLLAAVLSFSLMVSAQAFTTYGPVKRGETLWSIAKKTRPNRHVSIDLMMSAIQKLNPQSFDNLSKGTLHVGAKLEVPSTVAELRDVLHGKLPAGASTAAPGSAAPANNTPAAVNSTQPAVAPEASTATPPAAPAAVSGNLVTATTPLPTGRNKTAELQNMVVQLQQQLQASQAQVAAATQTQQDLKAAQQQIKNLQTQLQQSNGSFPWAWLWFIILALGSGYIVWNKRREPTEIAVPEDTHIEPNTGLEPDLFDAQPAQDEANGSILADALIAMAEGDYKTAKRILLKGVRQEHDNIELRMKLLEVYVQLNDRDAFNAESDYLLKNLISETDDAWKTVRAMYLKKWVYDA